MKHALVLAITFVLTATLPAQTRPTRIFVSVLDRAGHPVLDLSAADFEVREGGTTRPVVRAALATEPMRIALLVDTSEEARGSLNFIRNGLHALLDAIPAGNEVLLMSMGNQARVRVPPTVDRRTLTRAVDSLFTDGGATVLLDALVESWQRFLRGAENRWPVFVILATNGPDQSNTRDYQFESLMREIQAADATAHAILLSAATLRNSLASRVSPSVTEITGGHYESLAANSALAGRMKALGDLIAAQQKKMDRQYEVEFLSGPKSPEARVTVAVAREGVTVGLAASRTSK